MKEPQTHTGRIAVVTGAARGIGYAVATKLAQRGARVALVDLERPDSQAAGLPGQALAIAADVSSEAGWAHIGERVRAELGDPVREAKRRAVDVGRCPARVERLAALSAWCGEREVNAAQQEAVTVARRLEGEGKMVLKSEQEEAYVV